MVIQVQVLDYPWVLDLTGVGLVSFLYPRVDPYPTRTESCSGAGFIFHPWVHLKPQKKTET
jgi:hypothetical protein